MRLPIGTDFLQILQISYGFNLSHVTICDAAIHIIFHFYHGGLWIGFRNSLKQTFLRGIAGLAEQGMLLKLP
jgi:hypothetical protein